jgi:hypothetical protein
MILDYVKLREEFEEMKKRERREKYKKYDAEDDVELSHEEKEDLRRKQVFWEHLLKKK